MTAAILGAGDFPRKEFPRYLLRSADIIICCDSAFAGYLRQMTSLFGRERLPEAVVGDMDSIPASLRRRYSSLMVHIDEQDDNDQTKAFRFLIEHFPDVSDITIVGATGKREAHTIGNISLLMEYTRMFDLADKRIQMVSDYSTIFAITDTSTIDVGEGRPVSIFSPDNTLKIKSAGLQWPTDTVVFDNWWPATLNRATHDRITLTFSHPSLALVILD
jgi:thiamine pyrophosphokinase